MTAPDSNAITDLEQLFEPWRRALLAARVRPVPDLASARDDPGVWVEANYPLEDPATASQLLEAIDLFALLEQADRVAWMNESRRLAVLWAACPWARYVLETRPYPRLCGWRLIVHHDGDVTQLCTYLTAPQDLSAAYLQIRRALESMIQRRSCQSSSLVLDVRLPIGEWQRAWEVLPPIMALADRQALGAGDVLIDNLRSRLECVNFPPLGLEPADDARLDQLMQLCRLGVAIEWFPILKISVTRDNAVAFVTLVQTLLGSRVSGVAGRTRCIAVRSREYPQGAIELATTDATTLDHIEAMCPGDAQGEPAAHKQKLYWMAYMLFSRDARARNVCLNCEELTVAKVATMEELMRADEPLTLLFEDLGESILSHKLTRLTASRFLLFDPTIEVGEPPMLEGSRHRGLRVLGSVDKWFIVLLPGWGKAWVLQEESQLSRTDAAIDDTKRIEMLELVSAHGQAAIAAVAALLRLVGGKVVNLHMKDLGDVPETETWWTEILNCCPELEELSIDGFMWEHLSSIVDGLTRSRAKKLQRLSLQIQYTAPENMVEMREIFAALAHRRHPFSRQVREFELTAGGFAFGDPIVDADVFAHALQMLDENQTLQRFRLELPVFVPTAAQATEFKAAFDQHQNRVLPIEANHIDVRAKAAFLSVLKAETTHPALRALDRGMIATILDFAPKPCYRCVNVFEPRVVPPPQ